MVRFILLRGALIGIVNKNGDLPIDLVKEIKTPKLANDVRKMLGPPGALDCLMLSTPTRKMNKKATTLVFFATLFLIV
jgi:hypothetical protein